jgi:hypothetical protein
MSVVSYFCQCIFPSDCIFYGCEEYQGFLGVKLPPSSFSLQFDEKLHRPCRIFSHDRRYVCEIVCELRVNRTRFKKWIATCLVSMLFGKLDFESPS